MLGSAHSCNIALGVLVSDSDDEEVEDPLLDTDFDENLYRATAHTEYDERTLKSIQIAKDNIQRFVVDEFITEAIVAATQLRNVLGDADAHAYDLAQTISDNLMVVSQGISKNPGEFVLAFLRAQKDPDLRDEMAKEIVVKVNVFLDNSPKN